MTAKPFGELTIGELKALTPEEVDAYAPELGEIYFEEHKDDFFLKIGRRVIADKIEQLKKMERDLEGE